MFELAGALLLTFFGALFIWRNYEYIFAFLLVLVIIFAIWAVSLSIILGVSYFNDWDGTIGTLNYKNTYMTFLVFIIGGYMWMLSVGGLVFSVQHLKEDAGLFIVTGLGALIQLALTFWYTIAFIEAVIES